MAQHVRKGDMVTVISGSDRGRTAKVLRVIPKRGKVLVQGINVCKRHTKPSQQRQQGGIVEKELAIDLSNVLPAVDGKPTRVRFQTKSDGAKVRVAVKGGAQIGEPLKKAAK